ncbi:MAG TPA: hypothetical protein VGR26_09225 [Acidimicrobiales bacterium]|nr:hypothetical protein [Acidimicrobiales bacterium]
MARARTPGDEEQELVRRGPALYRPSVAGIVGIVSDLDPVAWLAAVDVAGNLHLVGGAGHVVADLEGVGSATAVVDVDELRVGTDAADAQHFVLSPLEPGPCRQNGSDAEEQPRTPQWSPQATLDVLCWHRQVLTLHHGSLPIRRWVYPAARSPWLSYAFSVSAGAWAHQEAMTPLLVSRPVPQRTRAARRRRTG